MFPLDSMSARQAIGIWARQPTYPPHSTELSNPTTWFSWPYLAVAQECSKTLLSSAVFPLPFSSHIGGPNIRISKTLDNRTYTAAFDLRF